MKVFKIVVVILLIIIVIVVAGVYLFVKTTLPDYDGKYTVDGIRGRIEIVRDVHGIPHIFADDQNDLVFGLGYAMAQDRLWQMDIFRRASKGRLSEIFGKVALDADRFSRVLGFGRSADGAVEGFTTEEREHFESFLKGINLYIDSKRNELPVEFRLLGYEAEPFTPSDIIASVLYQAFLNNHNWKFEISRLLAISELGDRRGRELFPAITFHGPYMSQPGRHSTLEGIPASEKLSFMKKGDGTVPRYVLAQLLEIDAFLEKYSGIRSQLVHSNCWAVSGMHTRSGKALLSNDYHMPLHLPSLWYEIHLKGEGIDAMGITLPGFPSIIAGHNRDIAWGATTTGADTQDIFIEKLNPKNADEYLFRGRYEKFEKVVEKIYYKEGDEKKHHDETVLVSRHGPIINTIIKDFGEKHPPLALRTVKGAINGIITFSMKIYRCRNWEEFKNALSLNNSFIWNWVYADREGNIGFRVNGMIPIRRKGRGLEPVPGWSGEYEWRGLIPYNKLPECYNPKSGYIVTANNEISDSFPFMIKGTAFVLPYRAMRIEEMIREENEASYETMRTIQSDTRTQFGMIIADHVVQAAEELKSTDERVLELVSYLRNWDGSSGVDSVGMTIAFEVFVQLMDNMYKSRITDELYKRLIDQLHYSAALPLLMLRDSSYAHWYDIPDTEEVEGKNEIILKSLRDADKALTAFFGNDIADWRWGEIHTYTFKHALGSIPPFKWLWNIGPVAFPGDISTINPGNFSNIMKKPYEVTDGASMRHLVDYGDYENAKFVITTGQSERWLSPYYDDQTNLWLEVRYHPMWMKREVLEKHAEGLMIFSPRQ